MRIVFIIFFLVFTSTLWATEGFFEIDRDLDKKLREAFVEFPIDHDCGSVRIHKREPYFLTALHCFRKSFEPASEKVMGNPLNYDSLVYYKDLKNQVINIGTMKIRVLANGTCYTGFALDVFANATPAEIRAGINCLSQDWIIFERLDSHFMERTCAPVAEAPSNISVAVLGGPRLNVNRHTGLTQLTGRVYSLGHTYTLKELITHSSFPPSVKPLWNSIAAVQDPTEILMVTDADIINGISGGPVFHDKKLVGLSTVGLLPNFIYDYPGLTSMSEGYNFGIHGALRVTTLKKAYNQYFDCQ